MLRMATRGFGTIFCCCCKLKKEDTDRRLSKPMLFNQRDRSMILQGIWFPVKLCVFEHPCLVWSSSSYDTVLHILKPATTKGPGQPKTYERGVDDVGRLYRARLVEPYRTAPEFISSFPHKNSQYYGESHHRRTTNRFLRLENVAPFHPPSLYDRRNITIYGPYTMTRYKS